MPIRSEDLSPGVYLARRGARLMVVTLEDNPFFLYDAPDAKDAIPILWKATRLLAWEPGREAPTSIDTFSEWIRPLDLQGLANGSDHTSRVPNDVERELIRKIAKWLGANARFAVPIGKEPRADWFIGVTALLDYIRSATMFATALAPAQVGGWVREGERTRERIRT